MGYRRGGYEERGEGGGDLREGGGVLKEGFTLYERFEERSALYEKDGDITGDCSEKQIREMVEEISKKYKEQ